MVLTLQLKYADWLIEWKNKIKYLLSARDISHWQRHIQTASERMKNDISSK
jgi:hypothetical protein